MKRLWFSVLLCLLAVGSPAGTFGFGLDYLKLVMEE